MHDAKLDYLFHNKNISYINKIKYDIYGTFIAILSHFYKNNSTQKGKYMLFMRFLHVARWVINMRKEARRIQMFVKGYKFIYKHEEVRTQDHLHGQSAGPLHHPSKDMSLTLNKDLLNLDDAYGR